MSKNSINSFLVFGTFLLMSLGCGSYKNINESGEGDVERGRLRFAKGVTYVHFGSIEIYHSVTKAVFVNGELWSPGDDPDFVDRIQWCSASPNQEVEVLKCLGTAERVTYVVRMRDDQPEAQKIDENFTNSEWTSDGRGIKFEKSYLNAVTGELKEIGATRGRLKFGMEYNYYTEPNYGWQYTMGVTPALFVNGERQPMPDGAKFYWCDASPNPNLEILRCHDTKAIYILRMKNDRLDLQKIPEFNLSPGIDESKVKTDDPFNNIWTGDDGRWLLFHGFYLNVETGEKIAVKKFSPADGKESFVEPYRVVAVSPDLQTVVEKYDDAISSEDADRFVKLEITDIKTGRVEIRKASLTGNPWLTESAKPDYGTQPPPAASKHFVWEKGADGRDKIVAPELSGKFVPEKE